MVGIALATEDALSEAIGRRLLDESQGRLTPELLLRKGGFGYLKTNIRKWCELSQTIPVFILTDLDNIECPFTLINSWLGTNKQPPNLIIRVAVREIESWLLADHQSMKELLGKHCKLPENPDNLDDPKQHLLNLACKAPRKLRDDLVRMEKGNARQGLGYNSVLGAIVQNCWSPERAATRSPSLEKARQKLRLLSQSA